MGNTAKFNYDELKLMLQQRFKVQNKDYIE